MVDGWVWGKAQGMDGLLGVSVVKRGPTMQSPKVHIPIVLIDMAGFSKLKETAEQRMILGRFDAILEAALKPFSGHGDPRKVFGWHGTGDGYYVTMEGFSPAVAMRFAVDLERNLIEDNNLRPNYPLRLRVGLVLGDVEWVGKQQLSRAYTEGARLIDHIWTKAILDKCKEFHIVILTSKLFMDEWAACRDKTKRALKIPPIPAWEKVDFPIKHGETLTGYVRVPGDLFKAIVSEHPVISMEVPVKYFNSSVPSTTSHADEYCIIYNRSDVNHNFTGRSQLLRDLDGIFGVNERASVFYLAIHGLGGIGKTELVLEYWNRCRSGNRYNVMWWLRAETEGTLLVDMAALGEKLGCKSDKDDEKIKFAKNRLATQGDWLLIFDNAEDKRTKGTIKTLLPENRRGGHVIITSRSRDWIDLGMKLMDLDVFTEEESVAFLLRRSGLSDDKGSAAQLAKELGCLPLALEQAAAYMSSSCRGFDNYLHIYRERGLELLERKAGRADTHLASVKLTFNMLVDSIVMDSPSSIQLLNLIAFFDPDNIPEWLFLGGGNVLPSPLREETKDELLFSDAVLLPLIKNSIIKQHSDSRYLSLHRLVQMVIRQRLEDDKTVWANCAVQLIATQFKFGEFDQKTWGVCRELLPHASVAAEHMYKLNDGVTDGVVSLWSTSGDFLRFQRHQDRARDLLEHARRETKRKFGRASIQYANVIIPLGATYSDLWVYDKAGKFLRDALKIYKGVDGQDLKIAETLSSLCLVYESSGNYAEAIETGNMAIQIYTKLYGESHPAIADLMNSIGIVHYDLGEYDESERKYRDALRIFDKFYGVGSLKSVDPIFNLALLMDEKGYYCDAVDLYNRALEIEKQRYSPDHWEMSYYHNNLGIVFEKMGDFRSAREHLERGLQLEQSSIDDGINEKDYAGLARELNNLGSVLEAMGDYQRAKECCEKALEIDENKYGLKYESVAADAINLAKVLKSMGELHRAKELCERAVCIDEETFCENHPYVARDINMLGNVLLAMGKITEAKFHAERALSIDETKFGPNHPYVARDLLTLSGIFVESGEFSAAAAHIERAQNITTSLFNAPHPNSAMALGLLGRMALLQGNHVNAKVQFTNAIEILRKIFGDTHPTIIKYNRYLNEI